MLIHAVYFFGILLFGLFSAGSHVSAFHCLLKLWWLLRFVRFRRLRDYCAFTVLRFFLCGLVFLLFSGCHGLCPFSVLCCVLFCAFGVFCVRCFVLHAFVCVQYAPFCVFVYVLCDYAWGSCFLRILCFVGCTAFVFLRLRCFCGVCVLVIVAVYTVLLVHCSLLVFLSTQKAARRTMR